MSIAPARRALAASILALLAPAAHCVELGTLFNSPEERARLDRLRRGEPEAARGPVRTSVPAVTGYVKRSDGRNTVWIDGAPVNVGTPESFAIFESKTLMPAPQLPEGSLKLERKAPR